MTDFILGLAGVIQKEINMLGSVAQNSANANTVGYKAVQRFSTMAGVDPSAAKDKSAQEKLDNLQEEISVRLSDGALRYTGRNTDMALSGNAWFVIDTPQGARLTRDGRFRINENNVLVNSNGWPVVGEGGPVHVASENFEMSKEGAFLVNGSETGRLVLVSVQGKLPVKPDNNGLYIANGTLMPASAYALHQGMLEQSNVSLSSDMVKLMETSRHIESVQRALSAYDNVLSIGIGQIGKE